MAVASVPANFICLVFIQVSVSSERERASRIWKHFRLTFLLLLSPILKHPNKSFFNPIEYIWHLLHTLLLVLQSFITVWRFQTPQRCLSVGSFHLRKYSSEGAAREWSTVVDIFITPLSFKSFLLYFSRSSSI